MYPRSMTPLEQTLVRTVQMLLPALMASILLLAVPSPEDPFWLFIVHLSALVAFGVVLAVRLVPLARSDEWFGATAWPPTRRSLAGAATLVIVVTGAVALLTLASSAALRLQPSLQFLQLLSALDIAWAAAVAALIILAAGIWSPQRTEQARLQS